MRNLNIIFLFVLILLGGACATVQTFNDYDRTTNFQQYKTFAWLPRSDSVNNYWYDNQLIERNVKFYGSKEMTDRNFSLDVNNPDLLLEYYSTVKKQNYTVSNPVSTNNASYYNPNNYNQANGYGYNPNNPYAYNNTTYNTSSVTSYQNQTVEYEEGTLLIDIIDRKTNRLIWRGWSVGTITDEQDLETQLQTDIHKVFNQYPIKAVKQTK